MIKVFNVKSISELRLCVKEYYDRQKKDFSEYMQRVPFYVREVFQFVNKKINPIT